MTQTIQARNVDLRYLIDTFGLHLVEDNLFFQEWQESIPEIADSDKQYLDKVKAGFINLLNYPPSTSPFKTLTSPQDNWPHIIKAYLREC